MIGSSIGFSEEIKKLCQKMCYVCMLFWSADMLFINYMKGSNLMKMMNKEIAIFENIV